MDPMTNRPLRRGLRGLAMTVRGASHAHAELRSRILALLLLTLIFDVVMSFVTLAVERGHGDVHDLADAFFFTTAQVLTVSSWYQNPATDAGKVLDLVLMAYGVIVVTGLAGVFGSFFQRRSHEHATHAHAEQQSTP